MKTKQAIIALFCVSFAATSCCKSKSTSRTEPGSDPQPGKTSTGKPGDITIQMGGDGGYSVSGTKPMKGDPKDCAAFRACCSAREASLSCALIQTTEQDCGKARDHVRKYLAERGVKPPPGCK